MINTLNDTVREVFGREMCEKTKNAIRRLSLKDQKLVIERLLNSVADYAAFKKGFEEKKAMMEEIFFDGKDELDEIAEWLNFYVAQFEDESIGTLEEELQMIDYILSEYLIAPLHEEMLKHYVYMDLALLRAGLNFEQRKSVLEGLAQDGVI
ncbi:hypothetical protein [Thermosediminibacter oceani]|uniref:Uncharacterized protein n=1 Tax=Thermosediminibacter oceani (strain ATCC BAA-1034 / DSM 16646 / JW/IW-1228P) TaxID=555079 RepID=D9S3S0_THEOJ|nr:hypothetical protein [Thermosediminibacter oceani]ADL08047.1 hypothetical protein Toce_1292 [Thermosediminibacter oceani DSM 16646]